VSSLSPLTSWWSGSPQCVRYQSVLVFYKPIVKSDMGLSCLSTGLH
jgi:hypothetical protein